MKKIIVLVLCFIVCACTLNLVKLDAAIIDEEVLCASINDYEDYDIGKFGKLKLVSSATVEEDFVVYRSNWAKWQKTEKQKFVTKIFKLYGSSVYIDMPVKEIEQFRLEANEKRSAYFTESKTYSITNSERVTESVKLGSEFKTENKFDLGIVDDIFEFKTSNSTSFKVSAEFYAGIEKSTTKTYSEELVKNYEETYVNNRYTYVYVKRCLRQKFKILIGFEYVVNYDKTRKGSGLFGLDDNYTYTLKNYTIKPNKVYFLPIDEPYYHISYYADDSNGNRYFVNQTNTNIIFW